MRFSVIIPTYHRDDLLALCLERVRPGAQTLPGKNYEVIVTDAGTVRTSERLVRERFPWARWTAARGLGPGPNRNHGAREARGEWLVFVDDDCLPSPGWLAAIAETTANSDADIIEGRTIIPDPRDHPLYFAPSTLHGGNYWTCNLAVRRAVFTALGGFDPDLYEQFEDLEFADRFQRAGYRGVFCAGALVEHPLRRLGWRGLTRQTLRGRWHLLYALKTGRTAPAEAPLPHALWVTARCETANRLRIVWHLFTRPERSRWRSRWFEAAWTWATYPVLFPYLLRWDVRFRRMLRARGTRMR